MYATQDDMITRFGEAPLVLLTNESADATTIDATVIGAALQDASDIIDGYLQGRYGLPLPTTPRILVIYCCDLARGLLYRDRITEEVAARRDAAISYLKSVAKGDIALGLDDAGAKTEAENVVQVESAGNVFARDRHGRSW